MWGRESTTPEGESSVRFGEYVNGACMPCDIKETHSWSCSQKQYTRLSPRAVDSPTRDAAQDGACFGVVLVLSLEVRRRSHDMPAVGRAVPLGRRGSLFTTYALRLTTEPSAFAFGCLHAKRPLSKGCHMNAGDRSAPARRRAYAPPRKHVLCRRRLPGQQRAPAVPQSGGFPPR